MAAAWHGTGRERRVMRADEELLGLWAEGDRLAGQELFNRHFAAVRAFFRRNTVDNRDELVQQTFLEVLQSLPRYRGESSVKGFILAIARHKLYEHYRKVARLREREHDCSPSTLRDSATSPSSAVAQRESRDALASAVQSLPLDMQIALELTYCEGLAAGEIAAVLEVPLNTIYSRLHRARELLREQLRDCDAWLHTLKRRRETRA